jgi:hypothetical protein
MLFMLATDVVAKNVCYLVNSGWPFCRINAISLEVRFNGAPTSTN